MALRVLVCTFNVHAKPPSQPLHSLLSSEKETPDIIAIGLQEFDKSSEAYFIPPPDFGATLTEILESYIPLSIVAPIQHAFSFLQATYASVVQASLGWLPNLVAEFLHSLLCPISSARDEYAVYLKAWHDAIMTSIQLQHPSALFHQIACVQNVGLVMMVYAQKSDIKVSIAVASTGLVNLVPSKGGIGVCLKIPMESHASTTPQSPSSPISSTAKTVPNIMELYLVTVHLTPHVGKVRRRNHDLASLCSRLIFDGCNQFTDGNATIVFGDLNYRLGIHRRLFKTTVSPSLPSLLSHDELLREHRQGRVLVGFWEAKIQFPPTFKFKNFKMQQTFQLFRKCASTHSSNLQLSSSTASLNNTSNHTLYQSHSRISPADECDWSEYDGRRVPAWCDRIFVGTDGRVTADFEFYRSHHELTFSDHRPVSALFNLSGRGKSVSKDLRKRHPIDSMHREKLAAGYFIGYVAMGILSSIKKIFFIPVILLMAVLFKFL